MSSVEADPRVDRAHRVGERTAAGHDEHRPRAASSRHLGACPAQAVQALGAQQPAADLDDQRAYGSLTAEHRQRHGGGDLSASPPSGQALDAIASPQRSAAARARNAPTPTATTGSARGDARGDAPERRRRSRRPAPPRRRRRSPRGPRRRAARGRRTRRGPAGSAPRRGDVPRPSGNVHVHCSGDRLPRSRCASAVIANSSEDTGQGSPPIGTCDSDRRDVGPQRAGVDELAGEQPLDVGAAACGHLAAHDRDHVGGSAPAVDEDRVGQRARDEQRRRHPVGRRAPQRRRPRLLEADQLAVGRDHAQPVDRGSASPAASSTYSTPSRLLANTSTSSAVVVIATGARVEPEPPDDRRDDLRHRAGVAPHLERLGDDPRRPVAVEHRGLGVGAADVEPDRRNHRGHHDADGLRTSR